MLILIIRARFAQFFNHQITFLKGKFMCKKLYAAVGLLFFMFEVFGQPRPSNFPIGNLNATISQDIKKYPVNVTMAIDAVDIDIWVKCTSIYSIISVEQIKNNAKL